MEIVDNGVDYKSAPASYADLFQMYYPYVVSLVRKHGIDDNRKEDVASEILLRFFERDFLDKFDPDLVFHYDGQDRPARFKSFLTKFVLTYLKGHRDKQHRLTTREVLIFDLPVNAGKPESFGHTTTWGEVYGGEARSHEDDVIEQALGANLVAQMRAYIEGVPRRSRYDTCDLVALFDEVIRQIDQTGEWDVAELRAIFGVSSTAMHSWMWWLRENLAAALDRPVPAKRPRSR